MHNYQTVQKLLKRGNQKMHIDCLTRMKVLMEEVQILRGRLQQHDTGHIATAINVLEVRVHEIENNIREKMK